MSKKDKGFEMDFTPEEDVFAKVVEMVVENTSDVYQKGLDEGALMARLDAVQAYLLNERFHKVECIAAMLNLRMPEEDK